MILYLDTSALVKLYVREDGSSLVGHAVRQASLTVCHLLAYAELRAAFARKHRLREISERELAACKRELERTWPRFERLRADEALIRQAGNLAERFGLKGYDSVHLAAAEAVFRAAGPAAEFRFAAFDGGLTKAAVRLGMQLLT